MPLIPGTTLGPYEVLAAIGAGGMGEVYKARDTKLDRDVALKILPDAFVNDPERLARFQREAKVLASLNHPNIAAIYGLEDEGDSPALVLEYVAGPTLQDRIAKGPIPLDEALPIARQIAEALEAAHEQGIIHRDLKPANVKVKSDGTVKVLDFGLAKALQPELSDLDAANSPTMTMTAAATKMGVIMGTAAYMSPEQARGKTVDRRADIWAFGAVLFEMLTGAAPFKGEDLTLTLAAVVRAEPNWQALPADLSPVLDSYLRRCLDKDPTQRVQAIGDVRLVMQGAFEMPHRPPSVGGLRLWQRPVPLAIAAVMLVAITSVVGTLVSPDPATPGPVTRFTVPVEGGHEMLEGECPRLALSPDGRTLAYVTSGLLHLRRLDSLETIALAGTEGAETPFFSPNGRRIGFGQGDGLQTISVDGGPITQVSGVRLDNAYPCAQASWSPDGTIVYRIDGSRVLWRVPVVGGVAEPITAIRDRTVETFHTSPQVIDGGRQVLFTIMGPSGVWGDAQIVVQNLDTGERTTIVERGTFGRYLPSGHVVYADETGTILALPYDLSRHAWVGDPLAMESGVRVAGWGGAASFAVSDAGTAAFVHGSTQRRQLLWWVDRDGQRVQQLGSPRNASYLDISPDGGRLAVDVQQPTNGDIWLVDTETGAERRLTFDEASDWTPVWSPDGRRLAYMSYGPAGYTLIKVRDVDAGGEPSTLYTSEIDSTDLWVHSWSPDGDWLAIVESDEGQTNVYAVSVQGDGDRIPVAVTPAVESFPQFLPDGRWLAYDSNETGRSEVFVVSFPTVDIKEQVSTGEGQTLGGRRPETSCSSGKTRRS